MADKGVRPHRLEIFGCDVYVARSMKQWRAIQRRVDSLRDPTGRGYTSIDVFETGEYAVSFFIDRKAYDPVSLVDAVAHEASHGARFILEYIGETAQTHEVEPYLVGTLARVIWLGLHG